MSNLSALQDVGLAGASRFRTFSAQAETNGQLELLTLVAAGLLAVLTVAFVPLQMRMPGSAILKATFPIVLGVALVPRRYAGTTSGIAAAIGASALLLMGVGRLQPAAVVALLAIGPAIDLAVGRGLSQNRSRSIYLRFACAGLLANLAAFAVRWGTTWLGIGTLRPRMMDELGFVALGSFALCGILAGLTSAAICFRGHAGDARG